MDRVPADEPLYFGRPNTWGQRYANVILQRADLVVALGTRLGLQQTGFNWQEFVPEGRVVQVDVDQAELEKGHPRVDVAVAGDANVVLAGLTEIELPARDRWLGWCRRVKELMPVDEAANTTAEGYLSPYDFALRLSALCTGDDVVVPCSSGGGFTVTMQAFEQKAGQVAITDKGLASMGYGLGGAIGAGLAHPDRRVVLIEGDGGFAQNLQELGTVAVNSLRLKMFLLSNEGYASIRMTQRNYFGGQYLGCDTASGLGFPDWEQLSRSFGVPVIELGEGFQDDPAFQELFAAPGPALFVVPVDPEQTYFPKISSRITETGGMESNPLHRMSPDLPDEVVEELFSHR
jgi:acetolactate synthase-1/2/3 large subunit